jgi:hypothetical protein
MRRLCWAVSVSFFLALAASLPPDVSHAQIICVSNNVPPPELPVYEQPPIPEPGYIWTPGYWAGGPSGYFWVPGTWVLPPAVGLLWTPGYWGWRDGIYVWNAGYWGPHVGFYGGIDYGFGYAGMGYEGGRWENGVFAYNRTVNNFGAVRITNVYEKTVVVEPGASRVSFNGGSGGLTARPTPEQETAAHEQHVAADPAQLQHERTASADKSLLASENHGRPPIAATATPGAFTGKGVVAAREATPVTGRPEITTPGAGRPEVTAPGLAPGVKPTEPRPLEGNRPLEHEERPAGTATLHEGTPPPAEIKREIAPETKPLNTETRPLNTETKPLDEGRPPSNEAKLPPVEPHPQVQAPHPPAPPPPHVAATPHPAPPPHPPVQAAPHPKPPPPPPPPKKPPA